MLDRRLRDALATMMTPAEAAGALRSAILTFQQKPKMAKATMESRGWTASGGAASNGVTKPGVVVRYEAPKAGLPKAVSAKLETRKKMVRRHPVAVAAAR